MKVGDLVDWTGKRWLVRKVERGTQSAIIVSVDDAPEVIAADLDEKEPDNCKVIANPAEQWPFLTLMVSQQLGRLHRVLWPVNMSGERELTPLVDWARSDVFQMGGALFLNPALQLGFGHVIVAEYKKGSIVKRTTLRIPKNFGTSDERIAKSNPPVEGETRTAYDRLLSDDFDD